MILTVGVLAVAGCGKSDKQDKLVRVPGRVDLSQMQEQFPNPAPEIAACLDKIRFNCRYRTFDAAQAELDKLVQTPNLTEPQKKAVNEVIEQVKAAVAAGTGQQPQ